MKLIAGLCLILAGCTKAKQPLLQLEMYGDNQSALYIVRDDGVIAFGGGIDALSGITTWEGTLSDQQLNRLNRLIKAGQLESTASVIGQRFVISIDNDDSAQLTYVVPLTDTHATELYYYLEASTLSRIQSHLDALPKPSMDVLSERKIKGSQNESN